MHEILQPLDQHLKLLNLNQDANGLTFVFKLETKSASCPNCGNLSQRPHCSYVRVVRDIPIQDKEVTMIIHLHKWFCDNVDCSTKIFTERLTWLSPYRRKTNRMEETLRTLAFSMSCLQAEKVCRSLHMPTSHDTLLNLIKKTDIQSDYKDSPFCSH
ncbi:transposase family protein [Bacillus benzoevorans]|uniref:Transposase n=1 Tax=Bacillus benzoevorans TaxID=1456 RepID=A0A7X0LXQ7_9BACI|nr:transposase family protein [Bacillus benzoevorans]MBB6448033.1 transposase [Bacillus benzoevorans]